MNMNEAVAYRFRIAKVNGTLAMVIIPSWESHEFYDFLELTQGELNTLMEFFERNALLARHQIGNRYIQLSVEQADDGPMYVIEQSGRMTPVRMVPAMFLRLYSDHQALNCISYVGG